MPKYMIRGADKNTGKESTLSTCCESQEAAESEARGAGILISSIVEEKVDYAAAVSGLRRDGDNHYPPTLRPMPSDYIALSVFATAAVATGALVVLAGAFLILRAAGSSDMNSALMGLGAVASGSLIAGAGECMGIARKFAIARLL